MKHLLDKQKKLCFQHWMFAMFDQKAKMTAEEMEVIFMNTPYAEVENEEYLWESPIPFDTLKKIELLDDLIFEVRRNVAGMGKISVLVRSIKTSVMQLLEKTKERTMEKHLYWKEPKEECEKQETYNWEKINDISKDKDREYILCAAIHYKCDRPSLYKVTNLAEGIVLSGYRHANVIQSYWALTGKPSDDTTMIEEGFLTSKNRFVSRQEALEIAKNNNQLIDGENTFNKLYSENLY